VPPVKLKLMAAEERMTVPVDAVIAAEPVEVTLTAEVPVTVKLVTVTVFQTVPVPVTVMFPVPKAIVLTVTTEELKVVHVNVYDCKSNVPDDNVKAPVLVNAAPNCKIILPPNDAVIAPQFGVVAFVVTVPAPESASKVTVSAVVGTEAPPAPPVVADQFAVLVELHVPVPPTQKRDAIR
jgi:hypothetical protein